MSTPSPTNTTHYHVLGVSGNADQAAIRKAYLGASLKYHPDKNPGREQEAKAKFVEIGQAYSVLGDDMKRAAYDRELDAGTFRFTRPQRPKYDAAAQKGASYTNYQAAGGFGAREQKHPKNGQQNNYEEDEAFQKFADLFDETVSGMSEEEINMAMGVASVVGSLIGSIVASRATKTNNSFLSSAVSMVGSAMASRAASTLVQNVHGDSTQRVLERDERNAAIARGESVQQPTARESKDRMFKDARKTFQKVASAAMGGGGPNIGCGPLSDNVRTSVDMSFGNNNATRNSRPGTTDNGEGQFSWRDAAELAAMAACACAEMQRESNQKYR